MENTVKVIIGRAHYRTEITVGKHLLIADEPEELGGTDQGPVATEILLSSLGTCTAVTLRMYADRKEWPLEGVEVVLSLNQKTEAGQLSTDIERNINLIGNLTDEQRERLMLIADKCPVHKILSSPIRIDTKLV
jgi:putative redox protein